MPVKISIKTKDAKFKGDLLLHNVTVSGPRELFTSKLERFLFLHGLNSLNSNGGFNVWSTRYAITPPALYLAALLRDKYDVDMDRDLRNRLALATEEDKSHDGLGHFIGGSSDPEGGKAALNVVAGKFDFIANRDDENYERKALLEDAGWKRQRI